MIANCIDSISPDSLTGAIFALEGFRDACVILNGPTGCKFYHSAISESQFPRGLEGDPARYAGDFYFGQSRVPCTYLDGYDYVFGSGEKLSALLRRAAAEDCKLIAVVNSPGAALIGDDLERLLAREISGLPCLTIENTGYSGAFGTGYQNALLRALDKAAYGPDRDEAGPGMGAEKTVNLLGMCIYQKHYDENAKTLERLLALCGIDVLSAPGAGGDFRRLFRSAGARLNVAVYPEYAGRIAQRYESLYAIPCLVPPEGPPIGFDAAEAFLRSVCGALGADPGPALSEISRARARAYLYLARFSSLLGLPKGARFSVRAESSTAYALTKWLCTYLGMIPASVSLLSDTDDRFTAKLTDFLTGIRRAEALEASILDTPAQIVFADGGLIAQMKIAGTADCGVEIALPSLGYLDVLPKTLFAGQGALFLLEQLMNGLRFSG
jgi:nitrogenase molybdenum-iron protein alpha/beta subunit